MFTHQNSAKVSSTINDRFHGDPSIHDRHARMKLFQENVADSKANDAQVMHTNVRIGSYSGWKARQPGATKHLPPRSGVSSKFQQQQQHSGTLSPNSSAPAASMIKDLAQSNNIIWNESTDMFKTTKQAMLEDPLTKVCFSDYVPQVEEKKNKKNESCLNFSHRIDLKILNSIGGGNVAKLEKAYIKKKRPGASSQVEKDQIFTLG